MTKILRTDLLARLTRISPALSNSDVIPIATHYCFTGTHVFTYNDQIAMSTMMATDFTGAVPGKVLLSLLSNSTAEKVEMTQDGNNLVVVAASSRWELSIMPKEEFIFEMPRPSSDKGFQIKLGALADGLKACLRSIERKDPEQNGITLVGHDKGVTLYAMDGETISRAKIAFPNKFGRRVLLPEAFCKQLTNIVDGKSQFEIRIDKESDNRGFALATGSDVTLFGRLLNPSTPREFQALIKQYVPDDYPSRLVVMPDKLEGILDRAMVVMDNSDEFAATTITIKQGKAAFVSRSKRGTVDDIMQIDKSHEDVRIQIDPRHLKAGYDPTAKWMLTPSVIIIAKSHSLYLIGRVSPNK